MSVLDGTTCRFSFTGFESFEIMKRSKENLIYLSESIESSKGATGKEAVREFWCKVCLPKVFMSPMTVKQLVWQQQWDFNCTWYKVHVSNAHCFVWWAQSCC